LAKKKRAKGNRWQDHYALQAREEKWLARSVYKLEEIDKRVKLFRPGQRVLDLGCYPGSWSQYSLKRVGRAGHVTGIDITKPDRFSGPNFRYIEADVMTLNLEWLASEVSPRDVVLSDLAPRTSGVKAVDSARSMELARRALDLCLAVLETGGDFLCKIFEGEELLEFKRACLEHFEKVQLIRPSTVRKGSREIYMLGFHFRGSRRHGLER
jgi:23S rRNA (uridine2552-2'-O)-methyltransferase